MTDHELSLQFGRSICWISGLKNNYPDQYKWLMSFSNNKFQSLIIAKEKTETVRSELSNKISYLNSLRLESAFVEWAHKNKGVTGWYIKSLYIELDGNIYKRYHTFKQALACYYEWIKLEQVQIKIKLKEEKYYV